MGRSMQSKKLKRKILTQEVANKKLKESTEVEESQKEVPRIRESDAVLPKKVKWTNKQRILIFASRGISYRDRHLMEDLRCLLPHSKSENKKDKKDDLAIINEMAEMKNCNKCIYFENRKRQDLYMWISNISAGPSVKFLVQNVHTKSELKLTGNCLKGSRPLLVFDENFSSSDHHLLIKELLCQIFNAPLGHPKTQPFFDKVFVFSLLDDKIWFRNYQIVEEDGQLTEIGPRFVLNPIKVFSGSFKGSTLWSNPKYRTPNSVRSLLKKESAVKYVNSVTQKQEKDARSVKHLINGDPTTDFFETELPPRLNQKKQELFIKNTNKKRSRKNKEK